MAKKLIDLDEAAKMLGVSPETLNEMRGRHEITAYRDGNNWKFKAEDIEKLAAEGAAGADHDAGEFAEVDDHIDSILLSEVELGDSGPSTSSTVIGKTNAPASPDSDIQLAKSTEKEPPGSVLGSEARLAGGSNVLQSGSGLSAKFDDLDALDLDLPSSQESGLGLGSSGLRLPSGSDLSLDDKDLSLGEEPTTAKPSSDSKKAGGSAVDLSGADEDDDLVLGGSSGSDVTRSAADSGISLMDPSDSGLSLDEAPLELGGSAVESLELGEDDMLQLEEKGDSESATQLKADDDFLLTPLDEGGGEDSDSGSQVIALDSEGDFDESAATMLGGKAGAAMLEEDLGGDLGGGLGAALGPAAGLAAGTTLMPAARTPEGAYTVWNILLLTLCTLLLMVTGMMMYDLMRNMWSWDAPYAVNSAMMDKFISWFEN